ncbi:hypothetical protein AB4511_08955 [Vibrio sp. 10N.222.54.F6]|uniref:hypothetical protein n=1 Tax=unclassified Vibrio TaxID=2614977 RepID=UPI00354DB40C
MSQTITVYSSNYHHGSKSDGVSSNDLEPYISNNYASEWLSNLSSAPRFVRK